MVEIGALNCLEKILKYFTGIFQVGLELFLLINATEAIAIRVILSDFVRSRALFWIESDRNGHF
jgi:hypothetical protein